MARPRKLDAAGPAKSAENNGDRQSPVLADLLTRAQVIEELKSEIRLDGLTAVAARYRISPQQLSNICHGSAGLSPGAMEKLKYAIYTYYMKLK